MAVLSMSKQEFSRLDVLLRVQSGRLRVTDACVLIGLQRRQVFRLLRGLIRPAGFSPEVRFAGESPPEEAGFKPSIPLAGKSRSGPHSQNVMYYAAWLDPALAAVHDSG